MNSFNQKNLAATDSKQWVSLLGNLINEYVSYQGLSQGDKKEIVEHLAAPSKLREISQHTQLPRAKVLPFLMKLEDKAMISRIDPEGDASDYLLNIKTIIQHALSIEISVGKNKDRINMLQQLLRENGYYKLSGEQKINEIKGVLGTLRLFKKMTEDKKNQGMFINTPHWFGGQTLEHMICIYEVKLKIELEHFKINNIDDDSVDLGGDLIKPSRHLILSRMDIRTKMLPIHGAILPTTKMAPELSNENEFNDFYDQFSKFNIMAISINYHDYSHLFVTLVGEILKLKSDIQIFVFYRPSQLTDLAVKNIRDVQTPEFRHRIQLHRIP